MGAYAGAWRANLTPDSVPYVEGVWGNGISPALATRGGAGRNTAPGGSGASEPVDPSIVSEWAPDEYAFDSAEDSANVLYGYGYDDGTRDRPSLGESDTQAGTQKTGWPFWGPRKNGVPAGGRIRALNRGADVTNHAKLTPEEDVAQGWRNKENGVVADAETSDPSQYEMQTSMTQRDKTRSGSQVADGRENEFDAPIKSRITGQKLRFWSGEDRHSDMAPKAQDEMLRPFWTRQAATGDPQWMQTNELYVSEPMSRQPGANPYQGSDTPDGDPTDSSYAGFTDEDMATW